MLNVMEFVPVGRFMFLYMHIFRSYVCVLQRKISLFEINKPDKLNWSFLSLKITICL